MGEEPLVNAQPDLGVDVELGHPGADAVGVELLVPRAVERVGEVHPLPVSADIDHVWTAGQWHLGHRGMRGTTDDPAQVYRSHFAWVRRIGDVVLLQLSCAPAGDVEE